MYSLEQKLSNNKIKRGRGYKSSENNYSLGYLIIIIAFIIFIIRGINVINTNNERGGYAYVQLLNFSMPVVENQVYEKEVFSENKLSLKKVVLEALGLNKINTYSIVKSQVSILASMLEKNTVTKVVSKLTPFSLSENSIEKVAENEAVGTSLAYDSSLKKVLDSTKPEVLIFHTHTMEAYSEAGNDSSDESLSVVGVGDVITNELEKGYGISTIHDKTNHSMTYTQSYARSNETLKKYLDQYGDFKIIIDLHRDGVDSGKSDELKSSYTMNMNNENLAKMMFVTAGNSSRYAANESLVNELYNKANTLFPGLIKKTYYYEYGATAVNYSLSDNFVLIEVGSNVNTAEEAKATGKYIARIIAEHINR